VLDWRKLEKLRSTYLETLPGLADAEGRIHTTFNQTATATGRLSSSNPNLQNIPVRGAFGRRMRACFTAAPGRRLVCADYSQIELRVLACLSGEKALLDAFRDGQDIHARTAALLFDLPQERISADMRRTAKTVNFGLIYGMGAQKLARELGQSVKDAAAFITRYFARLPGLKRFYDSVKEEAAEKGYVGTIAGRRRLTPDIASQNTQLRAQAGRQAVNARIQGSAADIIKPAMIDVENDAELNALEARLILQIHDELLLEAPAANAEAARARLAAIMAGVKPGGTALDVELRVDSGCGHNWAEAH
jgi:DNA polymerase-1